MPDSQPNNAARLRAPDDFLSPAREKDLWSRRDEPDAKAALLTAYRPLCRALAMAVFKKSRTGKVAFEDYEAEALLTLVDCYDRYDPDNEQGARFGTFATVRIKEAMWNLNLRLSGPVTLATTKPLRSLFFHWGACDKAALDENPQASRYARQTRIAALMAAKTRYKNIDAAAIAHYEGRLRSRDLSLNAPVRDDPDAGALQDFIAADYGAADERLVTRDRDAQAALMQAALATLDERARTILTKRVMCEDGEESALQDLADMFGVSAERVRQIEGKALKQIRAFMGVGEPQTPKIRTRATRAKAAAPAL